MGLLRILIFLLLFSASAFAQQSKKIFSLKQCLETAWENNITMKQNVASVDANQVAVNQARMSRLPSLNASGSQSINFGRSVNPYDNTVVENQQVNSNNFGLSASVNLFSGMQNTYTLQQRQLNLKASKEDVNTVKNNIALGVVETFANVLSTKSLMETSKTQLSSTKAQTERTEKLVKAGSLPITSLYDFRAQLATEETNVIVAENNLDLAKLALAQWMQIDPEMLEDVEEPNVVIGEGEEKSAREVYEAAEGNQPQIMAARTRVMAGEKSISLARSNYYPSLSLQAGLFTNYSSLAQRFIPGEKLATPYYQAFGEFQISNPAIGDIPVSISQKITEAPGRLQDLSFGQQYENNLRKGFSLNLNIPIFNGFNSRYAIENAKISARNARLQLDQQKNQLRQSIQTALANEKAASKRLAAVEKQITALEEAYRSAEQRLNLGVLNPVDYLLAKNNLSRVQNDRVRLKYDYFIRRALVDFYLGKNFNFN
jgi:outer membrane protein